MLMSELITILAFALMMDLVIPVIVDGLPEPQRPGGVFETPDGEFCQLIKGNTGDTPISLNHLCEWQFGHEVNGKIVQSISYELEENNWWLVTYGLGEIPS